MSIEILPKKYILNKKQKEVLAQYLRCEIGVKKAGELMKIDHQIIASMVTSITRYSVIEGRLKNIEELINAH